MLFHNVIVKIDPTLKSGACTLSRDIFLSARSGRNCEMTLSAGNRHSKVLVKKRPSTEAKQLSISPDIGASLYISPNYEWRLNVVTGPRTIKLGPFIGIYGHKRCQGGRIFSEQTSFFRKLCHIARKNSAVAYVISPDDLDFKSGYTYGHILTPAQKGCQWTRIQLPLPDVFYDRGLFPRGPGKTKSMEVRRYLRTTWGEKFFNPKFFDKWRTHRWVSENPYLQKYLPATEHIRRLNLAEKLAERFPSVYLKPSGGSSGRGIIRVQKHSGQLVAEFFHKRRFHKMVYNTFRELWQDLLGKKLVNNTYIVQEDLNLAQYRSRPFDVRALMQKDASGEWILTGMAARVSGVNAITTNLHAGGAAEKIHTVLAAIFDPVMALKLENEIRNLCFLTCSWIEEVSKLKFGEIAVDIGISKDAKPWLIELNAVPGRMVFSRINEQGIRQQALARPIQYALFLAGFSSMTNDDRS